MTLGHKVVNQSYQNPLDHQGYCYGDLQLERCLWPCVDYVTLLAILLFCVLSSIYILGALPSSFPMWLVHVRM